MARPAKSQFVCQNCGAVAPRWAGKCAACGEWNTMIEEADVAATPGSGLTRSSKGRVVALETLVRTADTIARLPTGLAELDRVTGGGIVPGSALLIGGEPGIGKSTLLLQLAASFAKAGRRAVYFSGEEAAQQVRLRAERLGLAKRRWRWRRRPTSPTSWQRWPRDRAPIWSSSTRSRRCGPMRSMRHPARSARCGPPRSRSCGTPRPRAWRCVLVGHVTKDGQIAGPKVIEHMVDTVLYFEGDRGHVFRILRAAKNRFGATDEIGVFEMAAEGLREVANPSELFLGDRVASTPGSAVFAGVEGTRPILVEIQALVVPSGLGTPRRAVVGWDTNRLSMLLAVIDARCGISFAQHDVYLNVAGGLKITEPAADLAAAAALSPRSPTSPCRRTGSISARSACRARCGRPGICSPASRKPRNWASSRCSCRLPGSSTRADSNSP